MTINRDDFDHCPRCGEALDPGADRVNCPACKGVMIGEKPILTVVAESAGLTIETLPFDDRTSEKPALVCPACRTPMTTHTLYGIDIDRCAQHGLWFDGEELQRIMTEAQTTGSNAKFSIPQKVIGGVYFAGLVAITIVRFLYF